MSKFELIKQLETIIAFQTNCLRDGNWEDFDKAEDQVKRLEQKLLHPAPQEIVGDGTDYIA